MAQSESQRSRRRSISRNPISLIYSYDMPKRSSSKATRTAKPSAAKTQQRRIFVLDTNVLMHDPTAIFRFAEHDVYLPMVVLEELDSNKKGLSEASRNVRQVSRFLDDLMRDATKEQIDSGLPLPSAQGIGLREINGHGK